MEAPQILRNMQHRETIEGFEMAFCSRNQSHLRQCHVHTVSRAVPLRRFSVHVHRRKIQSRSGVVARCEGDGIDTEDAGATTRVERTSTTRVLLQSLLRLMPSPRDSDSSQRVYSGNDENTNKLTETVTQPVVEADAEDDNELTSGIAAFYDESSSLWESMWGEHMHHGYYDKDANTSEYTISDHREAQVLMIDKALEWAGINSKTFNDEEESRLLDVGCGIGGSSRYMVEQFRADCSEWKGVGVTLSPKQAARANSITNERFSSPVPLTYLVRDAVDLRKCPEQANVDQSYSSTTTFDDNSFDMIWSMESAEHIEEKEKFIKEMHRVCKPGGKIVLVTWCHRNTEDKPLTSSERDLLSSICDCYYLPQWCSINDYVKICDAREENNPLFEDIRTADWSEKVAPFWTAVIKSAIQPKGLYNLVTSTGIKTLRGALVMPLMSEGYKSGLIKFNLLSGSKPL